MYIATFLFCNEIQELHNSVKWNAFAEIKL